MVRSHAYTHVRLAIFAAMGLSACGRPAVGNGEEADTGSEGQTQGDSSSDEAEDGSGGATEAGEGEAESATSGMPVECEVCDGFEPIHQNDVYTGFHACPDGTTHRHDLGSCDPSNSAPACMGDEAFLNCVTDADCTDGLNGKCVHQSGFKSPEASCGCEYACETDDDCSDGRACICTGLDADSHARPVCVDVQCYTGDDCASGECGLSAYNDGCGPVVTLQCRADADLCRLDGDCDSEPSGEFCAIPWGSSEWQCVTYDCAAGRPYVVDGEARTAALRSTAQWVAEDLAAVKLETTRGESSELAAYWAQVGAFEHASVASFNRFALQLMSMGAPPELLHETQLAAADEVRHAQLAFGLASRYAGESMGPGQMALEPFTSFDALEVMRGLIEEGCVGETLAAIEAETAAAGCVDASVRGVLEIIARDELRHAQLAWRSLRWLLEQDESLREAAPLVFEKVIDATRAKQSGGVHRPRHGIVAGASRDRMIAAALEEVVVPLVDALFGAG